MSNISMVIGSWGSYNECNERSLGSTWLDLSDFSSYEEIEEELKKQGFELDGIDEELFIQDIEGLPTDCCNWDFTHPKELFELLQEADVIDNDYNYETLQAFLEIRSFDEFRGLVSSHGSNWNADIHIYKGYDWDDYGRMFCDESCLEIPNQLENFIDYEAYGKYIGSCYAEEYSNGIIEIY